jgi:hypothetical protein
VEYVLQLEIDQEALATTLEIGNHFVVVTNEGNMKDLIFGFSLFDRKTT